MDRASHHAAAIQKPVVAITMGDPAGIGPEVAVAAALDPDVRSVCYPVLYGPTEVASQAYNLVASTREHYRNGGYHLTSDLSELAQPGALAIHPITCDLGEFRPGAVSAACGRAAGAAVEAAVQDCLAGRVQAIATAPLHKEALHAAGYPFPGHTEMIASLCRSTSVAMLLCGDKLRVVHVTTHVSLATAVTQITSERVLSRIALLSKFLAQIDASRLPIAVAGLNPHAGESGLFGNTESDVIMPAILAAQQQGYNVQGPFAPDTVFRRAYLGEFAGVVAMYHDQGHIAMKMVEFDTAVNVSIGLPVIRTSADHGTAFDIAWRGQANPTSMQRAVLLAARLASH